MKKNVKSINLLSCNINIFQILMGSFIFLYILSVFILDSLEHYSRLSALCLIIGCYFLLLYSTRARLLVRKIYLAYAFFIFFCTISLFWSSNQSIAIITLFSLISSFMGGLLVLITLDNFHIDKVVAFAVLISCIILCLSTIPEILSGEMSRVSGLAQNPNSLALRLSAGAIILISFAKERTNNIIIWTTAAATFILFALLTTGSRKMIFVLIILLIIWLVSMIKVKQLLIHNFRRLIILSIIIGFISFTLFEIDHLDISKNALYERTVTVFDNSDPSASMRKQMIEDGVEMWKEYPLLGIGLDQYRVISVYGTYSHNNYVELLVNLGLIGLLLYYSIHLFILFSCLKNAMKSFIKIWSFASIALILMWDMALVSYNLKIIWILIPWAIYIGMRPRTACFFA